MHQDRQDADKPYPFMEKLMGEYESYWLSSRPLSGKRDLPQLDKALYRFFSMFPRKKQPDDFYTYDAALYKKAQKKRRDVSVEWDRKFLYAFFEWCRDIKGYETIVNPFSKERYLWRNFPPV